jgi:hypothetical protein
MQCAYCGSENGQSARYCQVCGLPLVLPAGQGRYPQQVQLRPDAVRTATEKMLSRFSNGVSWLLVSLGTFVVAFGFLKLIDFSSSSSTESSLRIIGYGIVVYAIAAVFVALSRFTKSN